MILTAEQQRWCADHQLGHGFDDDNEEQVQYHHVVEKVGEKPCTDAPEEMYDIVEPLCRSPRLWFHSGFGGSAWPVIDRLAPPEERHYPNPDDPRHVDITCEGCVCVLRQRGCP